MTRARLTSLAIAALITVVPVAVSAAALPAVVRIVTGVAAVFLSPGFALLTATKPENRLSRFEQLLASVGLSLAIATGMAVLLAALPIGMTRMTLAVGLAVVTVILACTSWLRAGAGAAVSNERPDVTRGRTESVS